MQTSITQHIRAFTLFLIAALGIGVFLIFFISSQKPNFVDAQKQASAPQSDLYSISETVGEKIPPTNTDTKFIFDTRNNQTLYGKGWGNEAGEETESIGGTSLWLTDQQRANDQAIVPDFDVVDAFFAPDGRIFYLNRDQTLYRFSLDLKNKEKILEKINGVSISSDGRKLVYQRLPPAWAPGEYFDTALGLHVYHLDTGREVKISSSWEDFAPFFAPEGKIMFFSNNPEGLASHFVMNEDGTKRVQITNLGQKNISDKTVPIPSERPTWSPDGRYLAYHSDYNIWLLEFDRSYSRVSQAKNIGKGVNPRFYADSKTLTILPYTPGTSATKVAPIQIDLLGNPVR